MKVYCSKFRGAFKVVIQLLEEENGVKAVKFNKMATLKALLEMLLHTKFHVRNDTQDPEI
jgi:hypothetical protein